LKKHVNHLHQIFNIFKAKRVHLALKKSFLRYPNIQLLDQKVDVLELIIDEKKIKIIIQFKFPFRLYYLEHYLGFTGWLRNYIPKYTNKAESLQKRKTTLLKLSLLIKGALRRHYSEKIILNNSTNEKRQIFEIIQKIFNFLKFLKHFNASKILYIDINASENKFGVIIYHIKN
jgi:hypothetical protein